MCYTEDTTTATHQIIGEVTRPETFAYAWSLAEAKEYARHLFDQYQISAEIRARGEFELDTRPQ